MRARIDGDLVDTRRAVRPRVTPAPSRTQGPQAPSRNRGPSSRRLPGMILTATSRIEGNVILRHHDLVTGEAIVGGNVLEERHRAPRRSARRPAPSRTTSSAHSRPRLPALNASRERHRHATGYPPQGAHPAARRQRRRARTRRRASIEIRADAPAVRHRATSPGHQAVRCLGDRTEQPTFSNGLPVRAECNAPERLRTEPSSHRAQRTARPHRVRRGHRALRHPA